MKPKPKSPPDLTPLDQIPEDEDLVVRNEAVVPSPDLPKREIIPPPPPDERRGRPAEAPPARRPKRASGLGWKLLYWSVAILCSSGITLYLIQTNRLVYLGPALVVLGLLLYVVVRET